MLMKRRMLFQNLVGKSVNLQILTGCIFDFIRFIGFFIYHLFLLTVDIVNYNPGKWCSNYHTKLCAFKCNCKRASGSLIFK